MKYKVKLEPAKIVFLIYFIYVSVISVKWFYVPGLSSVCLFGAFVLACKYHKTAISKAIFRNRPLGFFFLFVVINLIVGMMVAIDKSVVLSMTKLMLEFCINMIILTTISISDGNLKYGSFVVFSTACLMVGIMFTSPVLFAEVGTVYYTVSNKTNPHTVGIFLVLAIWAYIYLISYNSITLKKCLSLLVVISIFTYIIILTNSRKSLLAEAIVISFSLIPFIKFFRRQASRNQRLGVICISAILLFFIFRFYMNYSLFDTTNIFERIKNNGDGGNQQRIEFIKNGLHVFGENIITGVGINNYQTLYGAYTHCTYVEVLACCGIVGAIPFFISMLNIVKSINSARVSNENEKFHKKTIQVLFFTILVLAITQIVFYERTWMFIISLISSYGITKGGENK